MNKITLFWFRRDLRLDDNAGLFHALKEHTSILPVFIFDETILHKLEDRDDARVTFIYREISVLKQTLEAMGSSMLVMYGNPLECWKKIIENYAVEEVYTNHDYEPYARERDPQIASFLQDNGIQFKTFKDQVIFEKAEVVKDDGKPYTVFTPYSRKWKSLLKPEHLNSYSTAAYFGSFYRTSALLIPTLKDMGFVESTIPFPDRIAKESILKHYSERRDIPSIEGTSRLSVHLRFGTISIRALARQAQALSEHYLNELIWREFYQMILWHFPHVVGNSFKPAYDRIQWRDDSEQFEKWCKGITGYPIVDAGMRELAATGFMHNRVRMITASFLTKHLLIDWRLGEAWFARKLLDFELASNNGGWQWAAGSGCDAAPYFRVFNPSLQTDKFDPKAIYINKWVSEFNNPFAYPKPIVEHSFARNRAIETYKSFLS